jgi:hypothetical protein
MKSLRRRPASSTCPPALSRAAAIPACPVHGHRFNAPAAASTQLARKPEYVRQRRLPSPSSTQTVNSACSAPRASFRVASSLPSPGRHPVSAPAVLRAGGYPACLLSGEPGGGTRRRGGGGYHGALLSAEARPASQAGRSQPVQGHEIPPGYALVRLSDLATHAEQPRSLSLA